MRNPWEGAKEITMRHEEKYLCPEPWLAVLEHRLGGFLQQDKNQKDGSYSIRSLYFDTEEDRLYMESLDGVEKKDKYRLRFYNGSPDLFKLEKKTSVADLKKKLSSVVDCTSVRDILENGFNGSKEGVPYIRDPVLRDFYFQEKSALLRPKIVIDYVRTAFVSEFGNIRITLDRNIRATGRVEAFLDDDTAMLPLLPEDINLLEVKYDGIFPGYLARLLNIGNLERMSFSKYVLCRDMIMNNGRKRGLYEF